MARAARFCFAVRGNEETRALAFIADVAFKALRKRWCNYLRIFELLNTTREMT